MYRRQQALRPSGRYELFCVIGVLICPAWPGELH
jgi:hypothetical protein